MQYSVRAIAVVRSTRHDVVDDQWDGETSTIELVDSVPNEALRGLDGFSHVEVVAIADQGTDVPPAPWARRPRGNPQWPELGIFAQRNKDRPNRILISVVRIVTIEDRTVLVAGLDLIDGTPVIDLKPWFNWSGPRGAVIAPQWSDELGAQYF